MRKRDLFGIILFAAAWFFAIKYLSKSKEALLNCPYPKVVEGVSQSRINAATISCSFQGMCTEYVTLTDKQCKDPT